jgi:hypothetical protein
MMHTGMSILSIVCSDLSESSRIRKTNRGRAGRTMHGQGCVVRQSRPVALVRQDATQALGLRWTNSTLLLHAHTHTRTPQHT